MRRWTPLFVAPLGLMLLGSPAQPQDLDLQILAGLSSATHTGNGAEGFGVRRTGLVTGLGLAASLTPSVGIALQALYTQKGSGLENFDDTTLEIDYLELPLLLVVSVPVGDARSVRPMLMAGPALGIKLRARFVEPGFSFSEEELGQQLSSTDLGVALGGGVGIAAGRGHVLVLGRYVGGLQNAYAEPGSLFDSESFKNQSLQAMVGYSFPIGALGR